MHFFGVPFSPFLSLRRDLRIIFNNTQISYPIIFEKLKKQLTDNPINFGHGNDRLKETEETSCCLRKRDMT